MARLRKKQPPAATTNNQSLKTGQEGSKADSVMVDANGLRVGSPDSWSVRTQWIFFAIASGACAAFNGVFAKLTTTGLTTSISKGVANIFGLSSIENIVEVAVRGMFFVLNLVFNGVMWSLFTTALARGTSTTQVSIMNTSANFMLTAFMGWAIFSESLPAMWWLGAVFLVAGNVIIGRKDETKDADGHSGAGTGTNYAPVPQDEQGSGSASELRSAGAKDGEDEEEDVIDLGDLTERR